ncbi:hypothetical protein HY256_12470, partial [Candidatus Sumerlaeota bacterium]|nr:hypothetical protein [Candidatus Sumerlaeota bacterium]
MKGMCNRPSAAVKILFAFAALAWAGAAAAQTAEEVIAKNLEAIGGMKNIEKIKTFTRKGEANLDGQFGQLQGTTELKVVVGQKVYQGLDLNVFYRISVWLGGDSGWQDDTMNGLQDVSGEKLSLSKNQSQINPFITYKKDGVKATKLDDEKVAKVSLSPAAPAAPAGGAAPASGGAAAQPAAAPAAPPAEMVDCYVLQMENPTGNKVKIYIDKKTTLILQM